MATSNFPIPSPDVPLVLRDGRINEVWYRWLKQSAGGDGGVSFPPGQVDGYVLGTDGITPSWVGFLQAGFGAVLRTFIDKMRDIISVKDWGTNSAAFTAAMAANSGVYVPPGAYAASVTVAYDNMLELASGASISSVSGDGTVVRWNYNPTGLSWNNYIGKTNKAGLQIDMGSYGQAHQGGDLGTPVGVPCSILGTMRVPASATTSVFGAGVAGYSGTHSVAAAAVGVYGEGESKATDTTAWGGNFLVTDNGFDARQLWGIEIDSDIHNVNSNILGIDIIGGSTVTPAFSIACSIQQLGTFSSPPKKWVWAHKVADGSATIGMELGAAETSGSNIGSMPLDFAGFNASGGRVIHGEIGCGPNGTLHLDGYTAGVSIRTTGGTPIIQAVGSQLGFFNQGLFSGIPTVSGSKGGNAALASLITALRNMGLLIDVTT